MFRGRYEHTIDGKGRTALPARFREVLAARAGPESAERQCLVVTTGLDPCLVCYPLAEWSAFEERLRKLPQFDPSVVQLLRLYVSSAVECPVDRQGRLLIPPTLREHARLDTRRHVIWAGMLSHIELWSRDRWRKATEVDDEERTRLKKAVGDLGL